VRFAWQQRFAIARTAITAANINLGTIDREVEGTDSE
jgi:hypothetical protein